MDDPYCDDDPFGGDDAFLAAVDIDAMVSAAAGAAGGDRGGGGGGGGGSGGGAGARRRGEAEMSNNKRLRSGRDFAEAMAHLVKAMGGDVSQLGALLAQVQASMGSSFSATLVEHADIHPRSAGSAGLCV